MIFIRKATPRKPVWMFIRHDTSFITLKAPGNNPLSRCKGDS
ncbi:hypothetical protein PRUB_a4408 [Pseudoalteromonas rubra]|uniref:Uncharacterized protein n=1 Tax=Pseudoalteromonas rubra TaxID=43658 RepID=A0A8T0C964_9GAMM|nr:hypothetical protein PRUB_a4408 [Pseudoalteromonas rubra]